ncbi:MAG: amidinotransferase [Bacteroidetes bacterium]|nr:amidinotransferase [Bacteroidota bacterium]
MVRPAHFGFNAETAANNAFQVQDGKMSPEAIRQEALREFDQFVSKLREAGVQVLVAKDSARPVKPDAVFPNNWVSFHQEGFLVTYPMFAPTRRKERRRQILELVQKSGFYSDRRVNLEFNEKRNRFLEGTGSIIFDHVHCLAYACLSPRTDAVLLEDLCKEIGYQAVVFHAVDANGQDIYHTNVMMAMGENFVVICLDTIQDKQEKELVLQRFRETGKMVIELSLDQMNHFAGNMLQVRNPDGQTFIVMSEQAYKSLTSEQISDLEQHTRLLYSPLYTIEKYGGGSARCMMAEIFLPQAPAQL